MTSSNILLVALFVCHWLADYTHLSTAWMLNAKRFGKPLLPILSHALVRAVLMTVVLMFFTSNIGVIVSLFFFQLITHFLIDVWKGRMNEWFPPLQSPANKWHWVVFGLDQMLHTWVIVAMATYATSSLR